MSYAEILGGFGNERIEPVAIPDEVRAVWDTLPENVRVLIVSGKIRIEVTQDGEEGTGKTILLIHDDPYGRESMAERLGRVTAEGMKSMRRQEYVTRETKRTKFDIQETIAPSVEPFRHDKPRTGRNERCPCGSGKKYKACHMKMA